MDASQTQPLHVIAWTREPALPGLGRFAYDETSFAYRSADRARSASFEAHQDTYYRAFGQDNILRQNYEFVTTLPEGKRAQALADAAQAADLIASSPSLAKLRQVDADTFFYGDPNVTPGRGKVLVQRGDDRRYFIGDLDDMHDIATTAKHIAHSLITR